ncbi:MAG: lysophospholipid acyltransferase family protein [Gemmatimonadota bacterium]
MRALGVTLVSAWTWFVLAVCIVLWLPLMAVVRAVTQPFDRKLYAVGRLFRWVGIITGRACPLWRFSVEGIAHRDSSRACVVVSNHESFVDIFLISHLPWEMKWMFKQELFRIPVLGWLLRLSGDIPIIRGASRSAAKAMRTARDTLERGMSVMIFAEGTRSATGELLPFKDGAFRLAIDAGVPILPLAVTGTRHALNKHDWRVGPADAHVQVLPPVETTGLGHHDIEALKTRVRSMIAEARSRQPV